MTHHASVQNLFNRILPLLHRAARIEKRRLSISAVLCSPCIIRELAAILCTVRLKLECGVSSVERKCCAWCSMSEMWPGAVPWAGWTWGRPCHSTSPGVHFALSFTRHSSSKACRGEQFLFAIHICQHPENRPESTAPNINAGCCVAYMPTLPSAAIMRKRLSRSKGLLLEEGHCNLVKITQADNHLM